jgi:nitroreductase
MTASLSPDTLDLIRRRKHVGALAMSAPGPTDAQMTALATTALAAPDHGKLLPFRLIAVAPDGRAAFTGMTVAALKAAMPEAEPQTIAKLSAKMSEPPALMLLIAALQPAHPKIVLSDQWLTVGCALQNLWLAAEAMGFACGVSSGPYLAAAPLRDGLSLGPDEHLVAIIAVGTPKERLPPRDKPALEQGFRWFKG